MPPRPNLFIVGAMKSGTTSLHSYLQVHPQIFMSQSKEPAYFVDELNWKRGEDWYLGLFRDAGDAEVVGESSTDYTKYPTYRDVAQRIARFNPAARFIYIMRDPVERTIGHYWHAVRGRDRFGRERRDLLAAIRENPHYRDVSHYAMQLEQYVRIFGRDRILAVTFEEMNARPEVFTQSIFRWLGVDGSFTPPNLDERSNVTPKVVRRIRGWGLLNRFRHTRLWNAVGPQISPSLRRVGRRLATDRVDRTRHATADAIAYLQSMQVEQTRQLSELLGREFAEWKTVHGQAADVRSAAASPRAGAAVAR